MIVSFSHRHLFLHDRHLQVRDSWCCDELARRRPSATYIVYADGEYLRVAQFV